MNLELRAATSDDRSTLDNLMQLYVHDFSEHWAGRAEGELDEHGRFPDYPLDSYWRDPAFIPLFIRANDHLAGFVLVNNVSHAGRAVDRNMAEFFIVRKYRRSGLGTLAAHQVFSRYPGRWEIAVARRNTGALAFWRRAVVRHPLIVETEELDIATAQWNGPVICCRVRQPN